MKSGSSTTSTSNSTKYVLLPQFLRIVNHTLPAPGDIHVTLNLDHANDGFRKSHACTISRLRLYTSVNAIFTGTNDHHTVHVSHFFISTGSSGYSCTMEVVFS